MRSPCLRNLQNLSASVADCPLISDLVARFFGALILISWVGVRERPCDSVENFLVVRDSVILNPGIRIVEAIGKATDMSLPIAGAECYVLFRHPIKGN